MVDCHAFYNHADFRDDLSNKPAISTTYLR